MRPCQLDLGLRARRLRAAFFLNSWLIFLHCANATRDDAASLLEAVVNQSLSSDAASARVSVAAVSAQGELALQKTLASAAHRHRTGLDRELNDHRGDHAWGNMMATERSVADVFVTDNSTLEIQEAIACHMHVSAEQVPANQRCPAKCPFWVEERADQDQVCHFQCVRAHECRTVGGLNQSIADPKGNYCRNCVVAACEQCDPSGRDRCSPTGCGYGYYFEDGECLSQLGPAWQVIKAVLAVVLLFLGAWYIDLWRRSSVNPEGLEDGLAFRSATKLHMPKDAPLGIGVPSAKLRTRPGGERQLWPLTTNLMRVPVAGPGLTLHFNFQFVVLLWATFLLLCWVVLACSMSTDLFVVGLMPAKTPLQLCSVVFWGHTVETEFMSVKILFILFAYVGTVFFSLYHNVKQLRRFDDLKNAGTMGDFVAVCTGLPILDGSERIEEELRDFLEEKTGEKLVGVSVCWDYAAEARKVLDALDKETTRATRISYSRSRSALASKSVTFDLPDDEEEEQRAVDTCHIFRSVDAALGFAPKSTEEEDDEMTQTRIKELLSNLKTSHTAFAVFSTEESRDAAVNAVATGMCFGGGDIQLKAVICEPDTIRWESYSVNRPRTWVRLSIGIVCIVIALVGWSLVFYIPYANYMTSFSFARGEEPTLMARGIFSMLVVVGNQIMYLICFAVADRVGFHFEDEREALYVILYTMACLINVGFDLAITGYMSYKMMIGIGAHTDGGKLLEDLTTFEQIFESYPMQKSIGQQLFAYCFPSCFLIPFIMEPIFAIFLPYHMSALLVGAHPQVRGVAAEKSLRIFSRMDLGRYADVLLNMTLVILNFMFPSGHMLLILIAFIGSHIYIYLYDHYRTLRHVETIDYANNGADSFANRLMVLPCAIMAGCLAYKALNDDSPWNCKPFFPCVAGGSKALWARVIIAFLVHVLLHSIIIWKVVPKIADRKHKKSKLTYEEVARVLPSTWFSSNPVNCLRSRYVYKQKPPCGFYVRGKEYLLRANPSVGAYYEDKPAGRKTVVLDRSGSGTFQLDILEKPESGTDENVDQLPEEDH